MRRPRPWAFGLGALMLALLLAPPSVFFVLRERDAARAHEAIQRAIAQTYEIDPAWRWHDFPEYVESIDSSGGLDEFGMLPWSGRGGPEERIDFFFDRYMIVAENEVPEHHIHQQLLESLGELASRLDVARKLPSEWQRGTSPYPPPSIHMRSNPHILGVRYASRLLRGHLVRSALDQSLASMRDDVHRLTSLGRAIEAEPHFIAHQMHECLLLESSRCLERVMGQVDRLPNLEEWQGWIEERLRHPVITQAMRGERAWWDGVFQQIESGELPLAEVLNQYSPVSSPPTPAPVEAYRTLPRVGFAHAEMLHWYNEVVALSRLPLHQQRRAFQQIDLPSRGETHPILGKMYRTSFESMLNQSQMSRTVASALVVALACERYRYDHEDWPANLESLQPRYLAAVPIDPIDGQPLRYSRRLDGICVYGVGYDGLDNDGNLTDHRHIHATDIGIRLWNPSERRKPYVESIAVQPRTVD